MTRPTQSEMQPAAGGPTSSGAGGAWWLLPLMLAVVAAVFWRSLDGELVYDDLALVARNPVITSFANVPAMFANTYWDFLDPEEAQQIAYWRPLTSVVMTLGYTLGEGRPLPFHALSLTLHLFATAAAFRLVRRLTQSAGLAFWTALLFGLHPLHVESVAWISAVNDPLYGLFSLLTLDAFLAWRRRDSRGLPWFACLWFALGLLSKEMAAATLLLLPLLDLARRAFPRPGASERFEQRFEPFSRGYAPLLTVLGVYYLARVVVFGELSAGFRRTVSEYAGVGLWRMLQLRIEFLGEGLGLMAWPADLRLFRMVSPVADGGEFALAALLVLALAVAGFVLFKRRASLPLAALLWIPLALLPALIRIEALGRFPISDRFFYLPVLGFALLLALAAKRWLPAAATTLLLAVVSIGYAAKSLDRGAVWRDEPTLFAAAVRETPLSPYVHWGLGRVLMQQFVEDREPEHLDRALAEFEEANRLLTAAKEGDERIFFSWDDRLQANLGMGQVYLLAAHIDPLQDYETPREIYRMLVKTPTFAASDLAWTGLGAALFGNGELSEAGEALRRALQLNERNPEAHFTLGKLYLRLDKVELARTHLQRALELRPGSVKDLLALADLEFHHGDAARGKEYAERARHLAPEASEPLRILGVMAAAEGDFQLALQRFDQALERAPEDGATHLERGKVLAAMGETDGAIVQLRRACDRLPESFEAHYNLGALLLGNGASETALPFLERAYESEGPPKEVKLLFGLLLDLHATDAAALLRFARLDLERGRDLEANEWIDRALRLEPGNPIVHYLRARIQRRTGLEDEAVQSLERSLAIHEENFQAHFEFGDLLAAMERNEEALVQLRRAEELGPPKSWSDGLRQTTSARLRKLIENLEEEP